MPHPNIFFFTGDNSYLLSQELKRWKQAFAAKYGEENLLSIDAREVNLQTILDHIATAPFLSEKRLVICSGMPRIDKEGLRVIESAVHPQSILAVVESKPDKRLGLTKELLKVATVKQFDPLSPAALGRWIQQEVRSRGSAISSETVALLLQIVGTDQWTLASEIGKLASFAGTSIEEKHLDALCVPTGAQVIWRLTDFIGDRRTIEAHHFFRSQIDRGEDLYSMWGVLLNMVKNLAAVWVAMQTGQKQERAIASAMGLNPLSVRGLMPLAQTLSERKIRALVNWATEADIALKTGEFHYSAERPEELEAMAERMILACN